MAFDAESDLEAYEDADPDFAPAGSVEPVSAKPPEGLPECAAEDMDLLGSGGLESEFAKDEVEPQTDGPIPAEEQLQQTLVRPDLL